MATLFSDNFNTGTEPDVTNWTEGGTWGLSGGALRFTGTVPGVCQTTAAAHAATADVKVTVTQKSGTGDGGPVGRCTDGDTAPTLYGVDVYTGKCEIYRHDNAFTGDLLRTNDITQVANGVIRLEISTVAGDVLLRQFYNGTQRGADVTDGSVDKITAAGRTGVYSWAINADGDYDDFLVEDFGGDTAVLTGTATASITEADIVAGGKTIIATLTGDTYVPASAGAITYVGGQGAGFAGTTTAQTITFALTGGVASTPAAGDLVIITYFVGSTVDRSLAIRNTSAVDYTLMGSELTQSDNFDANQRTAYRFMPGTPETQFVLTETVGGGTGSTADAGRYTVHVFRGVDTGTPMDVAVVTAGAANSSAVNPGAITPVTSGAWIYAAGGAASSIGSTMTSSNLTDFRAGSTADTNDASIGAGYAVWTSGAFDPAAFGTIPAGTTANSWTAITAALRPALTTPFNDARQAFIDGIDSAQAEANGWDAKRSSIPVSAVVRTSDTVVTVTLPALGTYNITAQETLTDTVPASILTGGNAIVATPTITIDPEGGAGAALAGSAALSLIATALLTTAITLLGQSTATTTASSTLTTAIRFAGGSSLTATAAGSLTTAIRLVGASTASATAASGLTTAIRLTGSASMVVTATGVVTGTAAALVGSANLTLTATGAMEAVGAALAGTASVALTTASTLSTAIRLTGVAQAALTSTSTLSTAIRFTGAAPLTLTASGALSAIAAALEGTSTATVTATSTLTTAIRLTGTATGTVTSTADLTTAIRLTGAATLDLLTSASVAPAIEPTPAFVIHVSADDVVILSGADDVAVTVRADDVVVIA